jgi:flagellar operon protein
MNKITFQPINLPVQGAYGKQGAPIISQPGTFQQLLEKRLEQNEIKFSSHALERLRMRNILLSNDDITRLNEAVSRAEDKGSRDSLVLMNNIAFVVSVKNKTIVTALTNDQMQDKVITNIDSTVLV